MFIKRLWIARHRASAENGQAGVGGEAHPGDRKGMEQSRPVCRDAKRAKQSKGPSEVVGSVESGKH